MLVSIKDPTLEAAEQENDKFKEKLDPKLKPVSYLQPSELHPTFPAQLKYSNTTQASIGPCLLANA